MAEPAQVVVHGPYEDLAIAALRVIEKIIEGQPPEIKAKLWEWFAEDMKAWREFWKAVKL
jgi:hypothetical protein